MLSLHTSPFHRCIAWEGFAGGCKPWRGGWGSDDNDDDPRGDDDINDVRPYLPYTTINLSDEEKGGLSEKEKGGGQLLWTRFFDGGTVTLLRRRRSG